MIPCVHVYNAQTRVISIATSSDIYPCLLGKHSKSSCLAIVKDMMPSYWL